MKLSQYIDTTYLKLPSQANISEEETKANVIKLIEEAIEFDFKLVMITSANSNVLIGTVIGFHEGTYSLESKLEEAQKAIDLGVDDIDFVVNYEAFKNDETTLVEEEIIKGTEIGLRNKKVVKWIIEVAALSNKQIASISGLIKKVVIDTFGIENAENVFL